jgi:hypothetical protein
MTARALGPLEVDPLIAEAKQRTRRRRTAIAVALTVAAVAAGIRVAHRPTPSLPPSRSSVPTLRGVDAFVTLVAIDRRTDVAEFRVKCGVFTAYASRSGDIPRGKLAQARVQPGLYRVPLRGGYFNLAGQSATPSGLVPSSANPVTLKAWERDAPIGWKASLYAGSAGPMLSSGPATDICHGVLG